jgi:hypothetical protein
MQITFTSHDGKPITVSDPRQPAPTAVAILPEARRPAGWIMTAWIVSTMKV